MKKIFLFYGLWLGTVLNGYSQSPVCKPDTSILKTINVIHPSPYRDTVPGSGIQQAACIGEPFALPFTILVPNVFQFGGVSLPLFSAQLPTTGAVRGLPDGLSYKCEPPNCVMLANTPGCIQISGTPTTKNDTGAYDLTINFSISTAIGPLAAEFPGSLFPGEYTLRLNAPGQCENTTAVKFPAAQIHLTTAPNPFNRQTLISFWNEKSKTGILDLYSFAGIKLRSIKQSLQQGYNQILLERQELPAGWYYYSLTVGQARWTNRLIIMD